MAGDASWKGTLALGPAMLRFEVVARAAVREVKVGGFNMHHGAPVVDEETGEERACFGSLSQSYTCTACAETQLSRSDSVAGYKGIPVNKTAYDSLAAEKSDTIELDGLVPAGSIDARWVQKSYDLIPGKGGEQLYALTREILDRSDQIGVGKIVMRGAEYIVAIRAREGVLAMELCYWPEEIEASGSYEQAVGATADVVLSDKEVAMGMALADMLSTTFDPSQYVNVVAGRKVDYLAQLVENGSDDHIEIKVAPVAAKVTSLEDALAASIALLSKPAAEAKGKGKKDRKAA